MADLRNIERTSGPRKSTLGEAPVRKALLDALVNKRCALCGRPNPSRGVGPATPRRPTERVLQARWFCRGGCYETTNLGQAEIFDRLAAVNDDEPTNPLLPVQGAA